MRVLERLSAPFRIFFKELEALNWQLMNTEVWVSGLNQQS